MSQPPSDDTRAAWQAVNQALSAPPPQVAPPSWWRRNLRLPLLVLAALVAVVAVVWRWPRELGSTPERAVDQAARFVADDDYAGLREVLCAPDRVQYSLEDITEAGRSAVLVLQGFEDLEVDKVVALPDVVLGPATLSARRVEGRVVSALGAPSRAWVTVVKELTAWRVCFSAGGYGLEALSIDVAPRPELLP